MSYIEEQLNDHKEHICTKCGAVFVLKTKYKSKSYGYSLCPNCIKAARLENRKKSTAKKYGSYENFLKAKQESITNGIVNKYGSLENYYRIKGEHTSNGLKETYSDSSKLKKANEKRRATYSNKTDEDLALIEKKRKDTLVSKYGSWENYVQQSTQKTRKTKKERYGCGQSPKGREAAAELCKSKEFIEKRKKTCLEKYGHSTYANLATYDIDGFKFDSSWEAWYYLYAKHENMQIIPHPKVRITYIGDDEKEHDYIVDFEVDGKLVEIKGNHLIRDGILCDTMGNKSYAKTKCLEENNVQIITGDEMKNIIAQAKNWYGNNYIDQFRRKHNG